MTSASDRSANRFSLLLSTSIFVSLVIAIVGLTFSIALSSIGLTLAILGWIVKAVHERKLGMERTPLDYFFLAYIFAELLSAVFAVEPWQSFHNSKRLLLISVVYLVGAVVDSEKKSLIFLGALVGVTGFLSVVELLEYSELRPERLFLFQHYMTTGGIKMIVLLLAIPFLIHRKTPARLRLLGVLAGLPILLALILTFTRSSWLGFAAGCVAIGILKNKYVLIALVVAVVLFLLFAPLPLRERAYSIVDPTHPNNVGRVHMWTTGIKIFKDYPILGVGDSDLHPIYQKYKSPDDIEFGGHLHNNIIMWLVTLGIVGTIILVSLFLRIMFLEFETFRRLKDHWMEGSVALGAIAVMVGFHINGLFEWNFGDQEIILLLWFSVGMVLAANNFVDGSEVRPPSYRLAA
jgi:putative inorganic carbon (HCO3(-)) transporter